MFVKSWSRLFTSRNGGELSQPLQVRFYLELDFETNVQVSYKNSEDQMKLKRFYGNSWSAELIYEELIPDEFSFKVFVYTPNLTENKMLKLGLAVNENQVRQEEFVLRPENDFAGWFCLAYSSENLD